MFVYYINVPKNEKGIEEFENYDEVMPNVETFELTEEEYNSLRNGKDSLFSMFDEKFGTIIDVCEEERIELKDLADAYELARRTKAKTDVGETALMKVRESLKLAAEAKTFWEIDIFLG